MPLSTRIAHVALLAATVSLPLSACTSGDHGGAGTDTASPTASASSGSDVGSESAAVAIPQVDLVRDVGVDTGTSELARDDLATLVAEQLGDGSTATVQTVVCEKDLTLRPGSSTACTVSLQGTDRTADTRWQVYATHNPDGSEALLLLTGDPLSSQFTDVLGTEGTYMTAASIDAAYRSATVPADQVREDGQAVLREAGSTASLSACEGNLSFSAFTPVVCTATQSGGTARAIVLPASFPVAAPGLLVVVQPGG